MTDEQKLWQAVLYQAFMDATSTSDTDKHRREKPIADGWIRRRGPDFRHVCSLAGMDADFLAQAYIDGRVDPERLRNAQSERSAA